MKRKLRMIVSWTFLVVFSTAGLVSAETNTETYEDLEATITAPDTAVANEDFEVSVEGILIGGTPWSVHAYSLYENADWYYSSPGQVIVSSYDSIIDVDGFNWGSSYSETYILNKEAGTYKYTFVFGWRWGGHGWYDVAVDVTVTVEGGCSMTTGEINEYIQGLDDDCFKNNPSNRKNTFENKLDAVQELVDEEDYQEAIDKLTNDIRAKVDGEGNNDWITCPDAQQDLTEMIDALIDCLNRLL